MAARKTNTGGAAGKPSASKPDAAKPAAKAGAGKPRTGATKSGAKPARAKAAGAKAAASSAGTTKAAAKSKPDEAPQIIDAKAIDVTTVDADKTATAKTDADKPEPVVELPEPGANAENADGKSETTKSDANEGKAQKDQPDPARTATAPTAPSGRSGFGLGTLAVTALLGGAIGWGAVTYLPGTDSVSSDVETGAAMSELSTRVDEVSAKVDRLAADATDATDAPPVDLAPLQARLDDLAVQLKAAQQEAMAANADLAARVETLETRSKEATAQAGPSAETIAALDDLSARIKAQLAANAEMGDQLSAALKDAQAKADEAAKKNARLARLAKGQVALTSITAALTSGQAFDGDIPALRRAVGPIPEELSEAAATGVTPLTDLQAGFDDLSRQALNATQAAQQDDGGGFWSFLRSQVSTRSTKPVEGDSADAILSRAGAAVKSGDLRSAVDLIRTLPAPAQEVLNDWAAQASRRQGVVDALARMQETLNP